MKKQFLINELSPNDCRELLKKNISLSITAILFLIILSLMPHPLYASAGDMLRVNSPDVYVRERPEITSPVKLIVQKDFVVIERSRQGEWVFVELPGNDSQGWIHARLLVRIVEKPVPAREKAPASTVKGNVPSLKPVAASESSPEHKGMSMSTAAGSALSKQPVTKVGVVYVQRIIDESVDGKKAKSKFEELAASTPAEDLKKIEQRLIGLVIERIKTIIARYARQEGYTHVVEASENGFLFTDERFDITDSIIKLSDQMSTADAGELPPAAKPARSEILRTTGGSARQ